MPDKRPAAPQRGPVTLNVVVLPWQHIQYVNREEADVHRDPDAVPPQITISETVPAAIVGAQVLQFAEFCRRSAPEADNAPERIGEAEILSRLVYEALPASHPVHHAFRAVDDAYELDDEDGDGVPSAAVVDTALAAFYALPEEHQRRILNGWRPCPQRPSRAEVSRQLTAGDVDRVLDLYVTPDGVRYATEMVLDCLSAPVRVLIQEGTTKKQALYELRAIALELEVGWDAAVDSPGPAADPGRRDVA